MFEKTKLFVLLSLLFGFTKYLSINKNLCHRKFQLSLSSAKILVKKDLKLVVIDSGQYSVALIFVDYIPGI